MTNKALRFFVIVLIACATALAQTSTPIGWTGRWSTDPPPPLWSGWTDSGILRVFTERPNLFDAPVPRPLNPNVFPKDVQFDLKVEGEKVTGFLGVDGIWELPMKIELGRIEGKTIRFMTVRRLMGREPIYHQWLAELVDSNTLTLRRSNISEGPGAVGRPETQGHQPAPPPTMLPELSKSAFTKTALTLQRAK